MLDGSSILFVYSLLKLPISSESGFSLIYTSGILDRYLHTIIRLMVQYLDILDIVLKLGQTSDDPDSLYAAFCFSPVLSLDDKLCSMSRYWPTESSHFHSSLQTR